MQMKARVNKWTFSSLGLSILCKAFVEIYAQRNRSSTKFVIMLNLSTYKHLTFTRIYLDVYTGGRFKPAPFLNLSSTTVLLDVLYICGY